MKACAVPFPERAGHRHGPPDEIRYAYDPPEQAHPPWLLSFVPLMAITVRGLEDLTGHSVGALSPSAFS